MSPIIKTLIIVFGGMAVMVVTTVGGAVIARRACVFAKCRCARRGDNRGRSTKPRSYYPPVSAAPMQPLTGPLVRPQTKWSHSTPAQSLTAGQLVEAVMRHGIIVREGRGGDVVAVAFWRVRQPHIL